MPNQPKPGTTRLEITLPKALKARAQAVAAERGESVSEAVRRYLEEDYTKEKK